MIEINVELCMSRNSQLAMLPLSKVIFAVVVWGISFIATKIALQDVSPITVIWLRFALGVLVLGYVVLLRGQFKLPSLKDSLYFALLGFIGITYHQWLQSTGLVTAQASTTAWIVSTTPIFIAILGWFILKESLNWFQIMGIGLASIGVLIVVSGGEVTALRFDQLFESGNRLILISAPNWAIFSVLSRHGLKKYPPSHMMFFVMCFGWVLMGIPFLMGLGFAEIGKLTGQGWTSVLFLGIACSGIAYVFWYDGLQALPAS
ncbi:MAG: DMT family transporter [Chloroflexota bacterium]